MKNHLYVLLLACSLTTLHAQTDQEKAQRIENFAKKGVISAGFDHFSSTNSAILPKTRLEIDGYNWFERFDQTMAIKDEINPQIILIGDSITHFWGGLPKANIQRGADSYSQLFGETPVLNLGFGWDRTQNLFCRIHAGQLDGLSPKLVILNIGTNNTSTTQNATANTPEEMREAYTELIKLIHKKLPKTRILVMEIFPRETQPDHPRRQLINQYNAALRQAAAPFKGVKLLSLEKEFTNADGTLKTELMPDRVHPNAAGYKIWADALKPYVEEVVGN